MRVFISWSGETSHQVALALRDWLPTVIQALDPWVSSEDISKGQRWNLALTEELANTHAAIACLTKDNVRSEWLNFEAGALARRLDARVIPFLFNMKSSELSGPLTHLQYATFEPGKASNLKEMGDILKSLNESSGSPLLREFILSETLADRWNKLETRLNEIADAQDKGTKSSQNQSPKPKDVIETLLDLTRDQARELAMLRRDVSRLLRSSRNHTRTSDQELLQMPDRPRGATYGMLSPRVRAYLKDEYVRVKPELEADLGRSPSVQELSAALDVHPDLVADLIHLLEAEVPSPGQPDYVRR
ncbi:MAG: toll/interleukin-1 receptor domain-containing protein [Chloroflexota bacterium]|nr:toll/interleukin-1 receptor domain-containing protein [Chloroflexota bacterium]